MGSRSLKRRKAKRKAEKERKRQRSIKVKTIFGVSLLDPDDHVSVKIGDSFIQKKARDLRKGEDVLFAKKGVEGITLEQAEEALLQSPRYAATAPVLFVDGTTAFNYQLRTGFGLGMEDDAKEAAERIREALDHGGVKISLNHIRNGWLAGKVIAPRNKDHVFSLLLGIAPNIRNLITPQFDDAYRLYITIRRTVMHSVSLILKGKGPGGGSEPRESKGEGLDTRPEIRLVAEHFAADISTEYASVNVLGVQEVRTIETEDAKQGVLFKGITSEDPPGKRNLKSMQIEENELASIYKRVLYEFLARERPEIVSNTPISYKEKRMGRRHPHVNRPLDELQVLFCIAPLMGFEAAGERNRRFIEKARKKLKGIDRIDQMIDRVKSRHDHPSDEHMQAARDFVAALHDGRIDEVYGFETGLLLSAIEYNIKASLALPEEFSDLHALELAIQLKGQMGMPVGAEVREFDKIRKQLIDEESVKEEHEASAFAIVVDKEGTYSEGAELLFSGKITPMDLYEASQQEGFRAKLIDDEVALDALRGIGFGELERIFIRRDERTRPYFDPEKLKV